MLHIYNRKIGLAICVHGQPRNILVAEYLEKILNPIHYIRSIHTHIPGQWDHIFCICNGTPDTGLL